MGREAFARARRFLDYNSLARWLAQAGAVVTGILYLALLLVLALFTDLVVNYGEVPCFRQLAPGTQKYFADRLVPPDDPEEKKQFTQKIRQDLDSIGLQDETLVQLALTDPQQPLSEKNHQLRLALLWYAELPGLLENSVDVTAGDDVRQQLANHVATYGPEITLFRNLDDRGILSLVVRKQASVESGLVNVLARTNPWMWRHGNAMYVHGLFWLALVIGTVRVAAISLTDLMAARAVVEASLRLRRAVYHHTYRLGTLAFRALGPTEAVSVSTRHVEAVHEGLLAWLTVYFREPVKFGLLLAFSVLVSFWLALAFLILAGLVWLLGGQVAAYFRRQGQAASFRSVENMALLQESLMLMRLVKVYLMEPFNQKRVERQLSVMARTQLKNYKGEILYRTLFLFLGLLATLTLLLVAGVVILHGGLGVTSVVVLVTALMSLYWPITKWFESRRLVRRGKESADIIFAFLDRPSTVAQDVEAEFLPAMNKQLEFDNVTLKEPGTGRTLLRNVSLTIPGQSRVALVGPDEMEKHALVYLIPRFLDPSAGEIRIDRKNIRWVTLDSLRAQIAIVLQHNLVFNDTVTNNIGCGDPSYTLPRIIEAAKIAHVHHFIQKLPQGYDTVIGDLGHPLRIGEQFRIALARAILRDPALFIIEEPVQLLDDNTKDMLDDTFSRILPGRTAIFLPHRLSTIRGCDRVYLLYQGKIEAQGDHKELVASSELYRHLQYQEFNEFAGLLQPQAATVENEAQL